MPTAITRTIYVANNGEEFATMEEAQCQEIVELLQTPNLGIYLSIYDAKKAARIMIDHFILTPRPNVDEGEPLDVEPAPPVADAEITPFPTLEPL